MENSIYKPPNQDNHSAVAPVKLSKTGLFFALLGSAFLMCLPIGILSTLMNLINVFQSIALFENEGNVKVISGAISMALTHSFIGFIACLPGAGMILIAVTLFQYRRPWVYRISMVTAALTLLLFPIGTVVGVILLIVLVKKKSTFFVQ